MLIYTCLRYLRSNVSHKKKQTTFYEKKKRTNEIRLLEKQNVSPNEISHYAREKLEVVLMASLNVLHQYDGISSLLISLRQFVSPIKHCSRRQTSPAMHAYFGHRHSTEYFIYANW
jgi:hypothetical protein